MCDRILINEAEGKNDGLLSTFSITFISCFYPEVSIHIGVNRVHFLGVISGNLMNDIDGSICVLPRIADYLVSLTKILLGEKVAAFLHRVSLEKHHHHQQQHLHLELGS